MFIRTRINRQPVLVEEYVRVHARQGTLGDGRRRMESSERISFSIRRKVHERAGKKCEGCFKIILLKHMRAHHLRRFVDGGTASLNNLACLCKPCHKLLHDQWPKQTGRWHTIEPSKIPRKHRDYIKWVFDWRRFAPNASGAGNVSVAEPGRTIEYRWERKQWRSRVTQPKRINSIKHGRRLLMLLRKSLKKKVGGVA